jgi:glycosyltransferase involved in cell wall biosynthesis
LARKKNLLAALQVLAKVRGSVAFNIYGPIVDQRYWEKCLETIKRLPDDKTVRYMGCVDHSQIPAVLAEHHLFFLPTLDENYGHVIIEALLAGCPILVSDRTPWRHLREAGVGWDLPLEHPAGFQAAIEECIARDAATLAAWAERAALFARHRATDRTIVEANRALFRRATRPRTVNSNTTLRCESQEPSL